MKSPARVLQGLWQDEKSCHHKKEGHGGARQDSGEHEVCLCAEGSERRGMDHDDKEGGRQLKAVDAWVYALFGQSFLRHPSYLQSVTAKPPVLVPETWKGRLEGRESVMEASSGPIFW